MNTPRSQSDPSDLPRRRSFATGCLTVVAWSVLGLTIGAGGGYFLYAKKPAEFQSTAVLQVTHQTATDVDDSLVMLSDPVLTQAVAKYKLDRLPSLQPVAGNQVGTPQDSLTLLRSRTKLQVHQVAPSSTEPVYEVRCNAALPSDCQAITNAVVAAYIDYLSAENDQTDWQSANQELQSARDESLQRIADLERQLGELQIPANASLQDTDVMSIEAEQWNRLQRESEQLHNAYIQVTVRLRQTESLIANGAAADEILAALGMPHNVAPTPNLSPQPALAPMANQADEQRKVSIAERERIRAEVERDLVPLQQELDRLLKIVASEHPKVRGVKRSMNKVRERLEELPPLPAPRVGRPEAVDASEENLATPSKGTLISARLRVLRTQRDELSQQMSDVDAQLEQAARLVALQKTELQEDARIRSEINVQQQLVTQAIEQLGAIPTKLPVLQTRAAILSSAEHGVRVAPWIWPHVLTGAAAGLLLGLVLAGLFLLTSGNAEPNGMPADN